MQCRGRTYDAACNKTSLDQEAASKMRARVYTSLLYRHWTQYQGKQRQHLLIQAADGSGKIRDLTPGDLNVPPFALQGPEDMCFRRIALRLRTWRMRIAISLRAQIGPVYGARSGRGGQAHYDESRRG